MSFEQKFISISMKVKTKQKKQTTETGQSHLLSSAVLGCFPDELFPLLSVSMVSCLHLALLTSPLCWRDSETSN